ncbi:hypothetical protein HK097_009093 [Rhizophlyctis rosea]|uniref:Uncharacterized protein n=1 Tax=Rhizophlyctis rosea TaxID=64517 RepID=A0AAD5X3H9_9FUNG|nr:hypothetical protein HK097_009093 [Rhizophlyctis rosea]
MRPTLIARSAFARPSPFTSLTKNLLKKTPTDPSEDKTRPAPPVDKYLEQHESITDHRPTSVTKHIGVPGQFMEYYAPARIKVRQAGTDVPLLVRCSICGSNQHLDRDCPAAPPKQKLKIPRSTTPPDLRHTDLPETSKEDRKPRKRTLADKILRIAPEIFALHPNPELIALNKWDVARVTFTEKNKVCNVFWKRNLSGADINADQLNANLQPFRKIIKNAIHRRIGRSFQDVEIKELTNAKTEFLLDRIEKEQEEMERLEHLRRSKQV